MTIRGRTIQRSIAVFLGIAASTSTALAACGRASEPEPAKPSDVDRVEVAAPIDDALAGGTAPAPGPGLIGEGGGGGFWQPPDQHVGGSADAPRIQFCGMDMPRDVEIVWCHYTPGLDLGRLAELDALKMLGLWGPDHDAAVFPTIDCSGIGAAKRLRELEIGGLDCQGLDALASLPALEDLRLSSGRPTDLAWIGRIASLKALVFQHDALADLGPLANLPHLERINIYRSKIGDLGPLAGLRRLWDLHLDEAPITDLAPLRGRAPRFLSLKRTLVEDLGPLSGSQALEHLWLDDTRVASLEPLRRLPRLRQLGLARSRVRDLSPLADIASLERVYIDCLDVAPTNVDALRAKRPDLVIESDPRRCSP